MGLIPDDAILDFYRTPTPTPQRKGLDVPAVIDDELSNLGYPEQSRLALLGNLGRENAWNPNTIFGGHNDPANAARNRGLMSWQGDRRTNLESYIKQNGGNWQPTEQNLRLQAQFLDHELKSKYPKIHQAITNPDVDLPTVSRQLRNYINYVPTAPYNTPDPEYDVKNNRTWAEKAKARGLASFSPITAYRGMGASEPEFDPISVYSGMVNTSEALIPEAPVTLDAQRAAANHPQSTRAGVLYTPGVSPPPMDDSEFDIQIPGGQTLRLNRQKFIDWNAQTGITAADIQNGADYTPLIGGKADPTPGVGSDAPIAVHTTDAQGNELVSSGVSDPSQIPVQAALDKLAFPNQDVQTSVVPADEVVAKRILDQMRSIEPVPTTDNAVPSQTPHPQPQQPLLTRKDGTQVKVLEDRGKHVVTQDRKGTVRLEPKRKFVTSEAQIGADIDPETGAPIAPQQQPQSLVNAKDADRAVAETIAIPDGLDKQQASDYVRKQLQVRHPQGDFSKQGIVTDIDPSQPVKITYGHLKAAGVDTATLIQQKVAENRVENPQQDLRPVELSDWGKEFSDTIKDAVKPITKTVGMAIGLPNPYTDAPSAAVGEVAALPGDLAGIGGGIIAALNEHSPTMGAIKEILDTRVANPKFDASKPESKENPKTVNKYNIRDMDVENIRNFYESSRAVAEQTGQKGPDGKDTIPTTVFRMLGSVPKIAIVSTFPGGMIGGFAIEGGALSKLRGGSDADMFKGIGKGALQGAIFKILPKAVKDAIGTGGEIAGATIAPSTTRQIVSTGVELATLGGTIYGVGKKFGDPDEENLVNSLAIATFHLVGKAPEAMRGKVIHAVDSKGNEIFARVEGDKLVSVEPQTPDIEMALPKAEYKGSTEKTLKPIEATDLSASDPRVEKPKDENIDTAKVNQESAKDTLAAESKPKGTGLSNTQVEFTKEQSKPFEDFRRDVIDKNDIADADTLPPYAKDGVNIEPHITVKYGLHTTTGEDVAPVLKGEKPIEITLGKTDTFVGSEKKIPGTDKPVPYDVVTVEVHSPDLARLNEKLTKNTDNTTTFNEYKPHITLAYVKSGKGTKYAGKTDFEGQKYTFDGVTFSPSDKSGKTVIPLTKPVEDSTPVKEMAPVTDNTATIKEPEKAAVKIEGAVAPKTPPSKQRKARSLSEFVRDQGGIKPTKWDRGEGRRLSNKETGTTGLINKNGTTAEYMAESAWESGYLRDIWGDIQDRNGNDFMNYVEDDLHGIRKHYSTEDYADDRAERSTEDQAALSHSDSQRHEEHAARLEHLTHQQYEDLHHFSAWLDDEDVRIKLNKAENFGISPPERLSLMAKARAYGVPKDQAKSAVDELIRTGADRQEAIARSKAQLSKPLDAGTRIGAEDSYETLYNPDYGEPEHKEVGAPVSPSEFESFSKTKPGTKATAFDQTDLFGRKTTPQTEQPAMFDKSPDVSDVSDARKQYQSQIDKLPDSPLKKDAEAALYIYARAKSVKSDVDTMLRQQDLSGKTFGEQSNLQTIELARAMDRGTFDQELAKGRIAESKITERAVEPKITLTKNAYTNSASESFKPGDEVYIKRNGIRIQGTIEKEGNDLIVRKGMNKMPLTKEWDKTPGQVLRDKQRAKIEAKAAKRTAAGKAPLNDLDADLEGTGRGVAGDPIDVHDETLSDYEAMAQNQRVRMLMSDLPVEGYEKGKASSTDVIKSYENILKAVDNPTPIRSGRGNFAARQAEGWYNSRSEIIRLRTANNIPTAAHETGHATQKYIYGRVKGSDLKSLPILVKQELVKMGKDLYGDRKPNSGYGSEGIAEFMRHYLTGEDAGKIAPHTLKWFEEEILPNHKKFSDALKTAKEKTTEYRLQGAANRAKADTVKSGTFSQRIRDAKRAVNHLTTQVIDEFTPLLRLSKDVESIIGKPLEAENDPFKVASFLRGNASAVTHYFVFDGTMDFARNKVGPSLEQASSMVRGKAEEFGQYLKARRSQELLAEGINPGMTKQDADTLVDMYGTPEFQMAAEAVYRWNNDVLQYVKESSPEMATTVDKIFAKGWENYVPMMREFDDIDLKAIKRINQGGGNPLKRIKGSGRRVKDIFPQMIANAEKLIGLGHRQRVLDTIVNLSGVQGMGHIIEEVPVDKIPHSTSIENIRKQLEEHGADLSEVDLDQMVTFFSPASTPKGLDPIVPIMKDGKMKWFQVNEDLYNTLSGLDLYRMPKVLDLILGVPTRMFRLGTTGLRASFSLVTNPTRDLQTFAMQSATSNPAKLLGNYLVSLAEALNPKRLVGKNNTDMDMFYRLGANLAQPLGADSAITRRTAKELFQGKVRRVVTHPIEMARELLSVTESVPRVAEIRNLAHDVNWNGKDPITFDQAVQLGLGAKQVTVDFSAAGSVGKKINQAVPFFNANVQGVRQFGKNVRDRPVRTVLYGLSALTLPTLALWWQNKDKDWYKDMPSREKMMYWNIESGDQILQIPRAFEYGNTFSVVPETLADAWYTQDPQGLKDSLGYIFDTTTPPIEPTLLRVAQEEWQNRISFFDRPIVPKAQEDMLPGEQKNAGTTELAKTLGKYFPNTISPERIDHIVRGLGGGTPIDIQKGIEQLIGLKPPKERQSSDMFAIGKLFRPGGPVGYNSKAIDKFYDEYGRLSQLIRSKDPEVKKQGERFGEAQKVAHALKVLREQSADDPVATNRTARSLLMRELVQKFLAGEKTQAGIVPPIQRTPKPAKTPRPFTPRLRPAQ